MFTNQTIPTLLWELRSAVVNEANWQWSCVLCALSLVVFIASVVKSPGADGASDMEQLKQRISSGESINSRVHLWTTVSPKQQAEVDEIIIIYM